MPAPSHVPPLPPDPMLPPVIRSLAESTLRHAQATPDHLLVLADACEEAARQDLFDHLEAAAILDLVMELHARASDYA